jgi:hypothetical protein
MLDKSLQSQLIRKDNVLLTENSQVIIDKLTNMSNWLGKSDRQKRKIFYIKSACGGKNYLNILYIPDNVSASSKLNSDTGF